jgi:hypothetical protein
MRPRVKVAAGDHTDHRGVPEMQRGLLCGVATMAAALAVFTGGAAASGPAPPGKELINLDCGGIIGQVTVSVSRPDNDNGAGQIVGSRGHGIPVVFTTTVTDVTTHTVLDSESSAVGGGHAHPNQATTSCSTVLFSAPASEFFGGGPLPPGVAATDTIAVRFVVDVVAKL